MASTCPPGSRPCRCWASGWGILAGLHRPPHALGALVEAVSGEHLGNIYRMVLAATGNVFQLLLTVLFMLITLFFV